MAQPRLGRPLIGVGSDNPHVPRNPAGPPHPARDGLMKAPSRSTLSPKGERVGFSDGH